MDAFLSDLGSEHRAKSVPLIPNSFMAHIDPALMQQGLDIAKREWESDVEHHRQADDLRRGFEIAKGTAVCHSDRIGARPTRFNPVSSDCAFLTGLQLHEERQIRVVVCAV